MPRWEPDAPERLERAAIELFSEQGFDATTVPEIAARAGLTTRSFFRHFADKREVLFRADEAAPEQIATLLANAPTSLSLMDMLIWGVETVSRNALESRRDELRVRRAIIATDTGLQEREVRKTTLIAEAISSVLEQSGIDALSAAVAGRLSVTISSTALTRWLDATDERPLAEHVHEVAATLSGLVGDDSPWRQTAVPRAVG